MIDHEAQRVRDVAFERQERAPVKEVFELNFASLEGVSNFRVLLRRAERGFGRKGYCFVSTTVILMKGDTESPLYPHRERLLASETAATGRIPLKWAVCTGFSQR